jgi:hypothetical protein
MLGGVPGEPVMSTIHRRDMPDEPIRITQTPGGVVPLATRDGVPVCAHCNEKMVEIDEDFWECRAARAELDAAIDRLLVAFEPLIIPSEPEDDGADGGRP